MLDLAAALFVFLVVGAGLLYAAFHRLTNATIEFRWSAKTTEPETSQLRRERDEARWDASALRAGLDALPPDARAAISSAIVEGGKPK